VLFSVSSKFIWPFFPKFSKFESHILQNSQNLGLLIPVHVDIGEDGLPRSCCQDCGHGHWLAGQAARDFTPTDMSTLNGINIEESSMSCWERHLRNDAASFLGVFNNFIIRQLIKVD